MSRFIIHGQRPLRGTYRPAGNKNAALPMLAAAVLTDEPVVLNHVPQILDVQVMLELLASLGVSIRQRGGHLTLRADRLRLQRLDADLCKRVRGSILLAGPLTARHGRADLSPPGGDIIGRRRLDTHFAALGALGIRIQTGRQFVFTRRKLRAADILLDEASVTATENAMMAATLAPGVTTLFNAACEPHVTDLGLLLRKMGARIDGLGTNRIRIEGVERLGGARHTLAPDHIEAGSFLAAAAATGGTLTVSPLPDPTTLMVMERTFRKLGTSWRADRSSVRLSRPSRRSIQFGTNSEIPKIEDGVWPAFPSDLMSVAIVLATQAKGTVLFFEKLFESRMYFIDHLLSMGAHIIPCDPHRVVVSGPSRLQGTHLSTPDIRAGMGLITAALCARGESVIENAQIIDRGYEHIDRRLRALGADIVREDA